MIDPSTLRAPLLLASALALDVTLGEYPNALHPVVWIGHTIGALVKVAPKTGRAAQLAYGLLVAIFVPTSFAIGAWILLSALTPWPAARFAVEVLLLKATFAVSALGRAAFRVERALALGKLDAAREGLRSLCSREPARLEASELVAATIESVAENTSDSFVAPLFFFALFGVPGAVAYRAINTLDAMIGYHGRYEYLGKASARLDDLANLAPARLTAALFIAAGALAGENARRGVRTWHRDASATESPNAGHPMATMAGLLGVTLAKPGHYSLGDAIEPLDLGKVRAAWRVTVLAVAMASALALVALELRHAPLR